MIKFVIPGEPQGKARARTGKGFAYTPEKTVNYENLVKQMFLTSYSNRTKLIDDQVKISVVAYYSIPKSATKGKMLAMKHNVVRPTKKPDCDNVLKIICDALNKIAYDDDSQIVSASIEKYYSDIPRVEVEIFVQSKEFYGQEEWA